MEPRVGIEPTTCALRKRPEKQPFGAKSTPESAAGRRWEQQPCDEQYSNDPVRVTGSGAGTITYAGAAEGVRIRVELSNGAVVSTEREAGEPLARALERLVQGLRQKGIVARRVGASGLQIGSV